MRAENRRQRRTNAGANDRPRRRSARPEEDGMGDGTSGSGGPRSAEDLHEAVNRIRAELLRIGGEIERTAAEQFEQRKPELRGSVEDLEAAIDALAARAKNFLGDLKARLDDAGEAAAQPAEGAAGSVERPPAAGAERR